MKSKPSAQERLANLRKARETILRFPKHFPNEWWVLFMDTIISTVELHKEKGEN